MLARGWARRRGVSTLRSASASDALYFRRALPPEAVVTDAEQIAPRNEDWMRKYRGASTLLLRPRTTAEVSTVLRYCNDNRIGVVPQGCVRSCCAAGVQVVWDVVRRRG
jgi:hypothetical protein